MQTVLVDHAVSATAEGGNVKARRHDCLHAGCRQFELTRRRLGRAIDIDHLAALQELHRTVDGQDAQILGDLVLDFLALVIVLTLQLAQLAATSTRHPRHLLEGSRGQFCNGALGRLLLQFLIRGPRDIIHARLLLRLELRLHLADGLRTGNLVLGRQHAVHDLANLAREDREILAELGLVHVVDLRDESLIDLLEPTCELVEQTLHLNARRLAFKQVRLKRVRKLLVVLTLLVKRHRVPRRKILDAEPPQQRVHVIKDRRWRVRSCRDIAEDGQEVVRRLVREGAEVSILV